MKVAMCCVTPDRKQRALLALVAAGLQQYSARHALPFFVIENPPVPEHMFWGKYFLLEHPELRDFDAVLVVDNDVLINPASPSVLEKWDPSRVGMVDERSQFGWSREHVDRYFADYDLKIPPALEQPAILNGGVLIYTREHVEVFRSVYENWLGWRSDPPKSAPWKVVFKSANDQAHIGLALQTAGLAQALDPRFNQLWWSWWKDGGRRSEWPFKFYAKFSKIVTPWLPRSWARSIAAPGLRQISRALDENYFLHFAGSKSPFHLLANRAP